MRPAPPADGAGADPPGRADARPRPLRLRRGAAPRRLRARRLPRASREVILIGTGSEVHLAVDAYEELTRRRACGRGSSACRPGTCSTASRRSTARACCRRPCRRGSRSSRARRWDGTATSGPRGQIVGMHTFGASAPLKELQRKFGFTPERVVEAARELSGVKPTQKLHELGQSLWVDNITASMLEDGTLRRYIDELSITGLTSNPTIFDKAISARRLLRRADRRAARARPRARAAVLRAGAGGPA